MKAVYMLDMYWLYMFSIHLEKMNKSIICDAHKTVPHFESQVQPPLPGKRGTNDFAMWVYKQKKAFIF